MYATVFKRVEPAYITLKIVEEQKYNKKNQLIQNKVRKGRKIKNDQRNEKAQCNVMYMVTE